MISGQERSQVEYTCMTCTDVLKLKILTTCSLLLEALAQDNMSTLQNLALISLKLIFNAGKIELTNNNDLCNQSDTCLHQQVHSR